MKAVLGLFATIKAIGRETLRNGSFGRSFAPTRKRLDRV